MKRSLQANEKKSLGIDHTERDDEKQLYMEHLFLLKEAGYIKGRDFKTFQGRKLLSPDLTWEEHELVATIRSKPVWEKVKSTASDKGLELSFDAVIALGKAALAAIIGAGN